MVEGRRAGRSSIGSAFAALFCVGVSTAATAWDDPQWVRQLGTSEWDFSNDVATDGEGDVYISGWTLGPLGGTHKGGADAWLAKYSAAGALLWKRQLGSSADDGLGRVKVATNGVGNVYISFDGANEGAAGSWLAAYSAGGRLLWTRHLATSLYDPGGIATDADRSIYVSGSTFGSLGDINKGGADAWLAKYSADGELRWTRQIGTSAFDDARDVATDDGGDIYISGTTNGSLGGTNTSPGLGDAWVAKYSSAGALRWKRQLGTSRGDSSWGVATDSEMNVYISGETYGSLGGVNATPGYADAWLAKYSATGALRWKRQLGTSGTEFSEGVATDANGNVYISGWTNGLLDGTVADEGGDAFLAKYYTRR